MSTCGTALHPTHFSECPSWWPRCSGGHGATAFTWHPDHVHSKTRTQLVDDPGRKSLSCCVAQKDFFFLKREVVTCSLLFVLLFFFLFGQFYDCFLSLICYLDNYFNSEVHHGARQATLAVCSTLHIFNCSSSCDSV